MSAPAGLARVVLAAAVVVVFLILLLGSCQQSRTSLLLDFEL